MLWTMDISQINILSMALVQHLYACTMPYSKNFRFSRSGRQPDPDESPGQVTDVVAAPCEEAGG